MKGKSKILYLGLNPTHFGRRVFHFPIIEIKPYPFEKIAPFFSTHQKWTHVILTSQIALQLFFDCAEKLKIELKKKEFLVIGKITLQNLLLKGDFQYQVASLETGEGVIQLIKTPGFFFYPHSALSRSVIGEFLKTKGYEWISCPLYETVPNSSKNLPSLQDFEEIVFTSPSCVDAFLKLYGHLPWQKKLTAIGPITQKKLDCFR